MRLIQFLIAVLLTCVVVSGCSKGGGTASNRGDVLNGILRQDCEGGDIDSCFELARWSGSEQKMVSLLGVVADSRESTTSKVPKFDA